MLRFRGIRCTEKFLTKGLVTTHVYCKTCRKLAELSHAKIQILKKGPSDFFSFLPDIKGLLYNFLIHTLLQEIETLEGLDLN